MNATTATTAIAPVICGQTDDETSLTGCPVAQCATHRHPAEDVKCRNCGLNGESAAYRQCNTLTGTHTFPAPENAIVYTETAADTERPKNAITATPAAGRLNEVIGTVTFTERSEPITENHTYYAADYRTYTILPGEYEVRLTREHATSQGHVSYTVDIEVTLSVLHDGIGGVNHKTHRDQTVRKETKTFRPYDYEAARVASEPRSPKLRGGELHLAEGWGVLTRHERFEDGRHYTSNKFVKLS